MSNLRFFLNTLLILTLSQTVMANCDFATDLLFYAYHLHRQGGDAAQQKLLFNKSLRLFPNRPQVHNTLASILKKQGKYSEAIYHYEQALELRPKFFEAWYGLGETYYKQERFPLSLEAHLHACQTIKDS
ncbi:acetylglucosaminyl-transferase, partial [Candidatus Thiomargarita nelsonii]